MNCSPDLNHFDLPQIALNILGILIVIFTVRPWVVLPTGLLGVVFVLLRRFYMASSRNIKRLEGITKSPVFSQLSSSLQGLTTIRAFRAEDFLTAEFDRLQVTAHSLTSLSPELQHCRIFTARPGSPSSPPLAGSESGWTGLSSSTWRSWSSASFSSAGTLWAEMLDSPSLVVFC